MVLRMRRFMVSYPMRGAVMPDSHRKIQQVFAFNAELKQIHDVDVLLERILDDARKLVNADAGTIYIKEGDALTFRHAQNMTLQHQLPPGKKLIYNTFSVPINHNSISGYVASTGETLNISDVYQLRQEEVPYKFNRRYDEKSRYRTRSVLTLPLVNKRREVIGVMQLINAQDDRGRVIPFQDPDIPIVRMFAKSAVRALERAQTRRTEILGMIHFLTEIRDPEETEAHVNRVGAYSAEIYEAWARQKGIPRIKRAKNSEILRMAAMLHDLGKLAIPKRIRQKSGMFTAEEYEFMKQHTVKGARMLLKSAQTEYEKAAADIALNHHEYWNGSGYPGHVELETGKRLPGYENGNGKPRGKQGEEIPIFGRIVAIADMFDALSCRRVFRDAMEEDDVLKILQKGAGKHFDPDVVDAFFSSLDMIHAISQRFPEVGE